MKIYRESFPIERILWRPWVPRDKDGCVVADANRPFFTYLFFFYIRWSGQFHWFLWLSGLSLQRLCRGCWQRDRHMPNFGGCQKHASHVHSSTDEQNCKNLTENVMNIFHSFISFLLSIFFCLSFDSSPFLSFVSYFLFLFIIYCIYLLC